MRSGLDKLLPRRSPRQVSLSLNKTGSPFHPSKSFPATVRWLHTAPTRTTS